jgi:hypothetical protein
MSEQVEVVHHIAGRIRLRLAEMKRNPRRAKRWAKKAARLPGVQEVRANPAIGSLLIHYEQSEEGPFLQSIASLIPDLDQAALGPQRWQVHADSSNGSGMAVGVTQLFRGLDKRVEKRTGGVDLRVLVPLLLVLLASGSLILAALRRRTVPIPSWYDLLWFAFNTFIILNLPIQISESTAMDH